MLASIAGLANSMLLSVLARKQEFGLRRAVGARRMHIGLLVLIESGFIGLIGGVGGLDVGYVAVLATTIVRHWTPVLDLGLVPLALIGGILAGSIGGVGAFWSSAADRASRSAVPVGAPSLGGLPARLEIPPFLFFDEDANMGEMFHVRENLRARVDPAGILDWFRTRVP